MNFKPAIKQAAAMLVAFNLTAIPAVAAASSQNFDRDKYLTPDYLSNMVGEPVTVFHEADLPSPDFMKKLLKLKDDRYYAKGTPKEKQINKVENEMLDRGFEAVVHAMEQKDPQRAKAWESDPQALGYLRFMVDSATVRFNKISGACLPKKLGCAIFISDDVHNAADYDAHYAVRGTKQLSAPEKFSVLSAWEELIGTNFMPMKINGKDVYVPTPNSIYKIVEQAQAENIVSPSELDSYFELQLTESIVKKSPPSFEMLSYYQYLKGGRDPQQDAVARLDLEKQVKPIHDRIYDRLEAGWKAGTLDAAREELKKDIVDFVMDASQPEAARFYAGAFLQMYEKRGDPAPANMPADFPFSGTTLQQALQKLEASQPVLKQGVAPTPSLKNP